MEDGKHGSHSHGFLFFEWSWSLLLLIPGEDGSIILEGKVGRRWVEYWNDSCVLVLQSSSLTVDSSPSVFILVSRM